jgi:hypothetical protein
MTYNRNRVVKIYSDALEAVANECGGSYAEAFRLLGRHGYEAFFIRAGGSGRVYLDYRQRETKKEVVEAFRGMAHAAERLARAIEEHRNRMASESRDQ